MRGWRRELIGCLSIIASAILTAMGALSGEQFVTVTMAVLSLYTASRSMIKEKQEKNLPRKE